MTEEKLTMDQSNGQGLDKNFNEENSILNISNAVRQILENLGENPHREGLLDTPKRVANAFLELLEGYHHDLKSIVNGALFDVEYGQGEMIVVDNIPYDSMCEHHMLPFRGRAHVAYIPSDKIIGLSKIPRIVEMFAKRLQVQERLTNQVANAVEEVIVPEGVMVVFEGEHMCAALRGIKKKGMNMRTTAIRGSFKEDRELRQEFYQLINE